MIVGDETYDDCDKDSINKITKMNQKFVFCFESKPCKPKMVTRMHFLRAS